MTGKFNGFIRNLEELLNKPLQWIICLLHTNELPLCHTFIYLDGTTNSRATFTGPIGKKLSGVVSDWPIAQFKSIPNPHFPEVSPQVLDDLSRDQYYSYRICKAVMAGSVESNLQYLEFVHLRWLTLGCGILRLYVSLDDPPSALMFLAEYCVRVYFSTWFDIKRNNKLTYNSKNFFNLIQRITQLSNEEVKHVALQNVQKNAFFAHPENILLAMLGDDNKDVRKQAVSRVQATRETSENLDHNLTSENSKSLDKSEEFNMYDPCVNVR